MEKWILAERCNTFLSPSPLRPPWRRLGSPDLPDASPDEVILNQVIPTHDPQNPCLGSRAGVIYVKHIL